MKEFGVREARIFSVPSFVQQESEKVLFSV